VCEANVYLKSKGKMELYFASVDKIIPRENEIIMEDIFGQKKIIKAKLKELNLVDHFIVIEKE